MRRGTHPGRENHSKYHFHYWNAVQETVTALFAHAVDMTESIESTRRASDESTRAATAVGLAVALFAFPAFAALLDASRVASIAIQAATVAFVVGVVVFWEERSLSSIGVRRPERADLGYFVLATALAFLAVAATGPLVDALGLEESAQRGLDVEQTGLGVALVGAVTIGVAEELLYRGYAIERLEDISGSATVAGLASWGVFTAAHAVSWAPGDLLQVSLATLVLTLVYVRRRSLVPVVGAHTLVWVLGVLGAAYG
jgi:membrane protease YdiL (CAAX protease family)